MRVLLIGASGQLGSALHASFSEAYQVVSTAHRHPKTDQLALDLADRARICTVLEDVNADLILIAGAMCAVDDCESEPERCSSINALAPQTVAEFARARARRVVFYSTDHVFDGEANVYRESDAVRPLNIYARSKVDGEEALRELLPDCHLILRTSWLYGPDAQRKNFALRCIDRIKAGQPVLVPQDQWGSPTYTEDLARATRFLVERGHTGTFHATGPDLIDRASLARRICARFGLDGGYVVPKSTGELRQTACRPLRVRLDCQKLYDTGAEKFRGIDEGLEFLALSETSLVSS